MSLKSPSLRKLSFSTLMSHHVIPEPHSLAALRLHSNPTSSFHVSPLDIDSSALHSCSPPPTPTINSSHTHSSTLQSKNISMASRYGCCFGCLLYLFCSLALLVEPSVGTARKLAALVEEQPMPMKYHNGALLKGNLTLNLVWYGSFTAAQRSVIVDFLQSLSSRNPAPPSVSSWWKTTEKYHGGSSAVAVGKQVFYTRLSLGNVLKTVHLKALASKPDFVGSLTVILTGKEVAVDGFCMSRCGTHGWTRSGNTRSAYIWVGNSETQCPGQCAWPFHQPIYGPQTPPLVAPNGDVGVDGMVINLATLLANTITNPFNGGYFQGPPTAPLEAVSACTGVFGSGAYPGYTGRVLVDKNSGASYNAQGVNGRRYLVPAMWDPQTSACATLV